METVRGRWLLIFRVFVGVGVNRVTGDWWVRDMGCIVQCVGGWEYRSVGYVIVSGDDGYVTWGMVLNNVGG